MSVCYNLRSLNKKKGVPVRICHLQNLPANRLAEAFNPKVCLERLKLLECQDIQKSIFYVEGEKITLKQNNRFSTNKKYLFNIFCIIFLLISAVIYWREHFNTFNIAFLKKMADVYPTIESYYSDDKFNKDSSDYNNNLQPKISNFNGNTKPAVLKDFVPKHDNFEIRELVRNYFVEMKTTKKAQNIINSPESFIKEQCSRDIKEKFSLIKKNIQNATFIDLATDYALESEGAKIVTTFNTQLCSIIRVKFLNLNLWPELSEFLMKHLKFFSSSGPNSILMPWKKPGDCWAFKGSYGRVQIELSEVIIVTAVAIDHVPRKVAPNGNIQSAPRKFSVIGIGELANKTNRTHLGTFEYKNTGPATQTFIIQPKVEMPFRRIEVIIESNHGNEECTCINKIRIHGRK